MDILPQLLMNSLITGSIYALVASGLALGYGLLRILNFAHGHIMMVGAYAFYFFFVEQEFGLFWSFLCTMAVAAGLGLFTLQAFVLPFTRYSNLLPLVTTLALSAILEATISLGFGVNVKSIPVDGSSSLEFYGVYVTPVQLFIIASALVLLAVLAYVVHLTGIGRTIRALREHPYAAQSLGISDTNVNRAVFVLSACLAAYAGILVGIETNIQPTMGNSYTMKAFATMILGGLGNIWGTVIGAYLLGFLENLSIGLDFGGFSLPAGYRDAFAYMIILLVLLVRPGGLFGAKARTV